MNAKELKAFLKRYYDKTGRLTPIPLLLISIPGIMALLTAYRPFSNQMINLLEIMWAAVSLFLTLLFFISGFRTVLIFRKKTREPLVISPTAAKWFEDWKVGLIKRKIVSIVLGVFLLLPGMLCLILSSNIYRGRNPYFLISYIGCILFFGMGSIFIFGGILRLILIRRIRYTIGDGIVEELFPKHNHPYARFAVGISLVSVIAVVLMFRGTWHIQPYIATIPAVPHRLISVTYDTESGIYTLKNPDDGDFRILQLTDIHLGGSLISYSRDIRALQTVYDLIDRTKPDFIIVTGDFVFPLGIKSFSFNNYTPMMQFCSFMRNIGIPWALVYGNHDTEFIASHSEEELNDLFSQFDYTRTGTLLYANRQPKITGRYNQQILLENADGSLNQVLFLLDSNSYTGKGINEYDYIHDDQVALYTDSLTGLCEAEGRIIPSMIFTHIPIQEYRKAYELYQSGDPAVTWYFGTIGEKGERINCSEHPSTLFEKVVDLGSTKGIFCGHDHYNNISLGYQGIRLTYGMSIDYLAMPGISSRTEQRGATEIIIHPDGNFDVTQVPYSTE